MLGGSGVQKRLQTRVAGCLVVQPRRADELVVDARQPRRSQVVGHQIGAQHLIRIDTGPFGDIADERSRCAARAPHRVDVALRIHRERLAVIGEVDRQLRHPQDRVVDSHQSVRDAGAVAHRQPPTDAKVAVQPRVQPGTAIGLQRDHLPTDDWHGSGCCLTRRLGLSVWPPMTRNGRPAASLPLFQATSDPARTMKNLPARGHSSASASWAAPAIFIRR